MSIDTAIVTYLSLRQRHHDLLESTVPGDRSKAARVIFDSIINGTERFNRNQVLNNALILSALGMILGMLSQIMTNTFTQSILVTTGIVLIGFGIYGSIKYALSSPK